MAVRGEEVASSIDAQVRESMERMVGEIRSSIEDVRATVDSQLKAALQSMQADVNSVSFLPQIRTAVALLEDDIAAAVPEPVAAPAPAGGSAERIRKAVLAIESSKSQVDVLNALLEQLLSFGSRAALLILRGETFSGWKGVGFSAHGGNDELIKRFNAAPGLIPELDQVLRAEQVVLWDGANLATRFGVGASSKAVLVPMVIKDKVAAAVYVDAVDTDLGKFEAAAVQLIVFMTGLIIDTLALRKKVPSPSLNEGPPAAEPEPEGASETRMFAPPPPPPPPAPAPAPAPVAAAPAPRPAAPPTPPPAPAPAAAPAVSDATVSFNSSQIREMMNQRPSFNVPSADDFGGSPTPAAPAAPPPPAAPVRNTGSVPVAAPAGEDRPSTQYIPPAAVRTAAQAAGAQNEEAKRHDEARRFARLLVSEIKLYNESKVEQGRKNRDLYERLKEDIDRSRQMYDERINEDVRKVSNYFYDELVRILADGNAEALGL